MAAYLVVLAEVTDPEGFRAYAQAAAALVARMGGDYIVRGPVLSQCLEGDWPDKRKIVISHWPSREAALQFWTSHEYRAIRALREGKATVAVRLVDGEAP